MKATLNNFIINNKNRQELSLVLSIVSGSNVMTAGGFLPDISFLGDDEIITVHLIQQTPSIIIAMAAASECVWGVVAALGIISMEIMTTALPGIFDG